MDNFEQISRLLVATLVYDPPVEIRTLRSGRTLVRPRTVDPGTGLAIALSNVTKGNPTRTGPSSFFTIGEHDKAVGIITELNPDLMARESAQKNIERTLGSIYLDAYVGDPGKIQREPGLFVRTVIFLLGSPDPNFHKSFDPPTHVVGVITVPPSRVLILHPIKKCSIPIDPELKFLKDFFPETAALNPLKWRSWVHLRRTTLRSVRKLTRRYFSLAQLDVRRNHGHLRMRNPCGYCMDAMISKVSEVKPFGNGSKVFLTCDSCDGLKHIDPVMVYHPLRDIHVGDIVMKLSSLKTLAVGEE